MKILKKIILFFIILVLLSPIFYWHSLAVKRLVIKNYYQLQALLPSVLDKGLTANLDVHFYKQERALSCEIAALRMVLNYYGEHVSENDLITQLSFETRSSRSPNNIWGDPNKGFVGDINGQMPDSGYGVYEGPIALVANHYRKAQALNGSSLAYILEQVAAGRPVIVWGHIGSGKDISWHTSEGEPIKAIYGEHARVVVGFSGPISAPKYLVVLDPIYGKEVWSANRFLKNWTLLDNRAVVVY